MRRVRQGFARAIGVEASPVAKAFLESLGEPSRREDDLRLLRALTESPDLRDREQDAFDEMLERLATSDSRELTKPQRDWAEGVADRVGIVVADPAARNARVPRGREVEAPAALSSADLKRALEARRSARGRLAR